MNKYIKATLYLQIFLVFQVKMFDKKGDFEVDTNVSEFLNHPEVSAM